jgi:hypothetical protein
MTEIQITLTNHQTDYTLNFDLLDVDIAHRWLAHVQMFIDAGQPWDDPDRFYNFNNTKFDRAAVAKKLTELVTIINSYQPIVERWPSKDLTQDDLNYLHHVFEVYHGLYDAQQNNDFFINAPTDVQNALGDLNVWIHRFESLGGTPRFVATWKYKPYREEIKEEEFKLFTLKEEWGDLRLNYCEIGKTLYDLWHDNDQYIASDAFKPLKHFCFDFNVKFIDRPMTHFNTVEQKIWDYFDTNQDFFQSQGYKKYDPRLSLGSIVVGKIKNLDSKETILEKVSQHQTLKSINIAKIL